MSIPSELGHLSNVDYSLPRGKTRWHKRVSNPGPLDPESYALPLRHTGWHLRISGYYFPDHDITQSNSSAESLFHMAANFSANFHNSLQVAVSVIFL